MIDQFGRCLPAPNRFPSAAGGLGFKPLANRLHGMGLKFGLHIMRGIPRLAVQANLPIAGSPFQAQEAVLPADDTNRTCVWNRDMFGVDGDSPAGRAWYASVARQYAAWGADYIKCDDIDYLIRGRIYEAAEIEALSRALRACGRSVVLSLSPGPAPVNCSRHLRQFANLWRISGDFWDNWKALNHNFDLFADWRAEAGPGHWPDGDMIPFGHICLRNCDVKPERWTRFTRPEQLTLMSLWCLESSPLMLGMNLPDNDEWTTALLTNPEVLAVDQDAPAAPRGAFTGNPCRPKRGSRNSRTVVTRSASSIALINPCASMSRGATSVFCGRRRCATSGCGATWAGRNGTPPSWRRTAAFCWASNHPLEPARRNVNVPGDGIEFGSAFLSGGILRPPAARAGRCGVRRV